jgi:tetratricopeptide (TPR) repeat protein
MVNGDLPTTYRLPPVASLPPLAAEVAMDSPPLFFPPLPPEVHEPALPTSHDAAAPQRAAAVPATDSRDRQSTNTSCLPAGSPPDDRLEIQMESDRPAPATAVPQLVVNGAAPSGPVPAEMIPCVPATTEPASQLLPAVQRGYKLAQRGALFAARTEFVQVLRRVAQTKDVAANSDEHSQALAAGLRALDEADDFVPDGVQLEAELDVRATASSHRTPALAEHPERVLPHAAVASYHDFAQQQLAKAVAGEQAGSMALYGLGRIDAQLAERRDDDVRFVRGAMTMYAAALAACPHNHLAANELGVLECRTGRPAEAVRLFERTIDVAPSATAYHNLAVAQQKLGMHANAQANEQESQRLAAWERARGTLSRRAGVEWVAPEEMAHVAQPAALTPAPTRAANAPPTTKSPWKRTIELARSLPRPGSASAPPAESDPAPRTHVVWPASIPNQSRWR